MRIRQLALAAITFLLGIATFAPQAFGQGLIIDPSANPDWRPPVPGPFPCRPISLDSESYKVTLNDQFAHIKCAQVFRNNTSVDLEGTYVFPLPPNADISNFALWIDGKKLTAETMNSGDARQIYEQIVNHLRDPGLLEYMGDGMIRASIYPIPANGTKEVDVEYDCLLPIDNDLMRLNLPLKLDGYSIDLINELAISIDITSPDPLGAIYSPTHDVKVNRDGAKHATVGFERSSHRPTGDFVLYLTRPKSAVGMNMLTHATGDNKGYFLAMIAPEYNDSNVKIMPKDFVLILDTSGSMAGEKIDQAKSAINIFFQISIPMTVSA